MKKKIMLALFIGICFLTITSVFAKSEFFSLKAGEAGSAIIKEGTHAPLHTAINASYMNEETISVQTTIQRKNLLGIWTNRASSNDVLKRSRDLNTAVETNFTSISGIADTKAIWRNVTSGTTVNGTFYINSFLAG